jgi:plastocyanin
MNPLVKYIAKHILASFMLAAFLANANADEIVVSVEKMQFIPQKITVKPGTTVKWLNNEKRGNHTISFEKEGLPESDRFFPGESWQRTFEKTGNYPYICGIHPEMNGVVEVAE